MHKKHFATLISLISLCMMTSFEVKANVFNSTVTSFNPLNWQLSGTSTITVDYTTLAYYNPNFVLTIKLTSANGPTLSSTGVVFAGGSPTASASTSVYTQANTAYFVSASHWLDCRNPVASYWGDDLGYGPKSPSTTTYNGQQFTVDPTGTPLLYTVREIYLGHTNGAFTTPAYNGAAMIDAVGFKGDVQLHKWSAYPAKVAIDPSDTGAPVWTRDGSSGESLVAYTLQSPGNQMTITASIVLTQIPPANAKANIRVKSDLENPGAIIGSVNNISLTYPVTTIPNIQGNLGVEPSYGRVAGVFEQFKWEISYNNGASWQSLGESWHLFAWIFRNPTQITPAAAVFRDSTDMDYPELYDTAVLIAAGQAYWSVSEDEAMTKLTSGVYNSTTYDPTLVVQQVHPLVWYGGIAVCPDFADMLRGLARSLGIAAETTYIWGGDPVTKKSNWFRYYPYPSQPAVYLGATLKMTRPQHRDDSPTVPISANPYFYYHTVVKWVPQNRYYDAAYGIADASISLLQSINYSSSPTCNGVGNSNRVLSTSILNGGFYNTNPAGVFISGQVDTSVITATCP